MKYGVEKDTVLAEYIRYILTMQLIAKFSSYNKPESLKKKGGDCHFKVSTKYIA
jgi:hypothetical protein